MEIILSSSILVLTVSAIVMTIIYGEESAIINGERNRALNLAEEGLEAIRSIKTENFANLNDGVYGLEILGNRWHLSASYPEIIDNFQRQIIISSVEPEVKSVESKITWQDFLRRTKSFSLVSYFSNWLKEVVLPSIGDWSAPRRTAGLDLPDDFAGIKIWVEGNYAYVVRNSDDFINNWIHTTTNDFFVIDISTPDNPQIAGVLNLPGTPRNLHLQNNYAYIASDRIAEGLQIVDISDPHNPVKVGGYIAFGLADSNGIFVKNINCYLARDLLWLGELYVMDISDPRNPAPRGYLLLGDRVGEITLVGNFLYVANRANTKEVKVVEVTFPTNPTLVYSLDLPGPADALSIASFGSKVAVGRTNGEVYLLDASTPNHPTILGSYNAGGAVNDISVGNNDKYLFLATSNSGAEFRVVDISNPANPTSVGALDLPASISGVDYDDFKDRAFVVGSNFGEEFSVIGPAP